LFDMQIVEKVSETEMVAIFLRTEITSSRFGKNILRILERNDVDRKIIDKPNIKDANENKRRAALLGEFRGYKRNEEIFLNFPDDARWYRVLLNREDLLKVKYMNYSYWNDISGGSRLVADAAKRIFSGEIENDEGFRAAAEAVRNGKLFEEIILVSENERSDLILLEGHLRATAYLMSLEYLPPQVSAIVGYSEKVAVWDME
jgi:hypothetical protein